MSLSTSAQAASPVLAEAPLASPWPTLHPFLVCMHHLDAYPPGDARCGPAASLEGRDLGEDFSGKDGWSMYHGHAVPGFPAHPHRGFETVTIVLRGLVDHADSLGAAARYGNGDVQWLTAGRGIQHSEMFPLVDPGGPNPLELFQIWLDLPPAGRTARPHFAMFWRERVPRVQVRDDAGRSAEVLVVAGGTKTVRPLPPPPESWAARPDSDLAIWTIRLEPGARLTLPPARPGSNRALYLHHGPSLQVADRELSGKRMMQLSPDVPLPLEAGPAEVQLLLLQGRPIGAPVLQHGPFVGGSREEIQEAYAEYRHTGFGGWPWPSEEPVHSLEEGRFAWFPDGRVERP
ncbi:MAG TPA: pirin family protein [Anaeromyxobacter sp.]|nr:pirin family protein [Anaeromyxobacter sp.]